MQWVKKFITKTVLFCVVGWLAGCVSSVLPHADLRAIARAPPLSSIQDALPKQEPRALYGNPDSYEAAGHRYVIIKDAEGFTELGTASWYGSEFDGRRTSSGEQFDANAMTAAHKTLPLPCYIRVINLDNGRQAVVKVNDRGPFASGRILDLSRMAAVKLGVVGPGSAHVKIEALTR